MSALLCLATAVFFEARGEPIDGKELVANVIINRVEHPSYPDTVCDVVNQPKQFSYTHQLPQKVIKDRNSPKPLFYNSYHDKKAWEESKVVAKSVIDNGVVNPYILMYHTTTVDPYWSSHYEVAGLVGNHMFYREKE